MTRTGSTSTPASLLGRIHWNVGVKYFGVWRGNLLDSIPVFNIVRNNVCLSQRLNFLQSPFNGIENAILQ